MNLVKLYDTFTGYKINVQKSVMFLYTKSKLSEKEIKKTVPLIIASKSIKKFREVGKSNWSKSGWELLHP